MFRTFFLVKMAHPLFRTVLGLATILLACSGCTMCCHPYDYSGPVYGGPGCGSSQCSRAGSILDGGVQDAQESQTSMPIEKKVEKKVVRESAPATSARATPARAKSRGQTDSFASAGGRVPDHLKGEAKPGDVPGSERIISVTERIVGASTPPADTAVAARESSAESSSPLPTSGWTARRPESEVLR